MRAVLATLLGALALAGCGSSAPTVCHVRPGSDGRTLDYSPAGCQKHLGSETLDVQSR